MNGRLYGNLRPGFYLLNVSCGKGLGNTREKVRFLLKLISPYMKVTIKTIALNIKLAVKTKLSRFMDLETRPRKLTTVRLTGKFPVLIRL